MVEAVYERRNELVDPAVSNVDQVATSTDNVGIKSMLYGGSKGGPRSVPGKLKHAFISG